MLTDTNRRIELSAGRDPEAYRLRAWTRENLRGTAPKPRETAEWLSSRVATSLGLNRTALVILKPVTRTARATTPTDWPTSADMWDKSDPVGSVFPEMVR